MNRQKIRQLEMEIETLAYSQPKRKTYQEQQDGMVRIVTKQVEYWKETGRLYYPKFRWVKNDHFYFNGGEENE